MHILIDLSFINSEQRAKGSLALYSYRFLQSLTPYKNNIYSILVAEEMMDYLKNLFSDFNYYILPKAKPIFTKIPIIKGYYNLYRWQKFINNLNVDTVYIPYAIAKNSAKLRHRKIITIHDLRPMRVPDVPWLYKKWANALRLQKLYLAKARNFYKDHIANADKVIAISQYVANDIIKEWPCYSEKINVVYNGVPNNTSNIYKPSKIRDTENYILYVNNLLEYKNIITLIKAFQILNYPSLKLIIVGRQTSYWDNVIKSYISTNNISNIIHLNYVEEGELTWLYKNARLFVTPSLCEGFGYTPIEAAIRMCHVISSTADSLPDVTAGKVDYYSPATDEKALAQAISYRLKNPLSLQERENIAEYFTKRYNLKEQTSKIHNIIVNRSIQ